MDPSSSSWDARYAQGLRAGIAARETSAWELPLSLEITLADGANNGANNDTSKPDETIARNGTAESGFDLPARLAKCAAEDRVPDAAERHGFAERGLLYLGPEKDGFTIQMSPRGGLLDALVLRELAAISQCFGNGSVEINEQGGLNLTMVSVRDAPEAWRRIEAAGLQVSDVSSNPVQGVSTGPAEAAAGCELPVLQGRLLSSQMLRLAAVIEDQRTPAALRLTPARGLVVPDCLGDDSTLQRCRQILASV